MATEMGKIDEMQQQTSDLTPDPTPNGTPLETTETDSQDSTKTIPPQSIEDIDDDEDPADMEDDDPASPIIDDDIEDVTTTEDAVDSPPTKLEDSDHEPPIEENGQHETITEDDDSEDEEDQKSQISDKITNGDSEEVHEILDDDDEEEEEEDDDDVPEEEDSHHEDAENGEHETIELNDSGEGEGDVMIIDDEVKENGSTPPARSDELEVIELDGPPKKKAKIAPLPTPRRSVRNLTKKNYVEEVKEDDVATPQMSEESDIEEVLPEDPLAMSEHKLEIRRHAPAPKKRSHHTSGDTIVVKDTKRLVEIAAKSNSNSGGNKKEPTLVIIDTNSILSGRGAMPMGKGSSGGSHYQTMLPMALPAQGMYPPNNMRATITPIPMGSGNSKSSVPPLPPKDVVAKDTTPVLPTLTDDMFVVEAPSFIVPYVYEKPPVADFKVFLKEVADKVPADDAPEDEPAADSELKEDESDVEKKPAGGYHAPYFDSPLGKFFVEIGVNLVQEFVQTDLLKQQKRKREREGGQNPVTNKTIHSLIKTLEFSKENNEPYKQTIRKCEFCNFKTESHLVMRHHLETPHTKNYVYRCNFCAYEARSPHDILFHMEAEHAVRGRLDRAPSFHQCPNCPFEDNQKGKLSRHLVACMRKFKPERNLDPPIDWEPPAKIPRVPKSRQGLNVSAYQAMKSSQLQFLSKMHLLNAATGGAAQQHALHRGRGRPTLGTQPKGGQSGMRQVGGMVYKQAMSGGSVLVPTNYQLGGNQMFQGGQSSAKNKTVHQPSISITPLPRASATSTPTSNVASKPGDTNSKNSFVICEICDGYIKDLEQLRNHMQWIHKVKIHPKMIYNRPPLNCQKCQFRFFTDQGLERHLLGSHGLVTSSMQEAANKSKDAGRCPVCGRVYQWKLLNHVARDHGMTLKPAHLSYKCTVCTATFGMYKQFENHVYSAHSVVAKRVMDKKPTAASSSKNDQLMKPLKINDEITIIPQPAKPASAAGSSKEGASGKSADAKAGSAEMALSTV